MSSDVSDERSTTGRLFHIVGPLTRKLRSPYNAVANSVLQNKRKLLEKIIENELLVTDCAHT